MTKPGEVIMREEGAPVPMTPGVGVAGQVMCPLKQFPQPCVKHMCEWWVELNYGDRPVARCAMAWLPLLQTENTREISRLNQLLKGVGNDEATGKAGAGSGKTKKQNSA